MWDTTKDYRLLIAEKSMNMFLRALETNSFKGHWNKKMARESAQNMNSDFQKISYSYMDPKDIAESTEIDSLENKAQDVIKYLGGDDWFHQFLNLAKKDEKHKIEETLIRTRFFINTILGLRKRMAFGPIPDPIVGVDIQVGEIMSASLHDFSDDLMICNVNLGKRAIRVITNDMTVKDGNKVGVALLPPDTFHGIVSEGMFLGAGEGIIKDIEGDLGEMPHGFPLEALNETRNLLEVYLKD